MKRFAALFFSLLLTGPSMAQGVVLQSGPSTQGHVPVYVNPSQIGSQTGVQDSGPAGGGATSNGASEFNITARGTGTPPFAGQGTGPNGEVSCILDAPINNATGYHYLCFSANVGGDGLLSYGAAGTATPGVLDYIINGVPVTPVTCSGTPTSSFATINGIVTHC